MEELDHNPVTVAAQGRCPRCASGRLFEGFLEPARECEACGLDFRFIDTGDGPAVFVILFVGFLTVGLALYAEVAFGIPLYVHFLLWPALVIVLSPLLLRVLKGAMIGQQFRQSASEGRIAMRGRPTGTDGVPPMDAVSPLDAVSPMDAVPHKANRDGSDSMA